MFKYFAKNLIIHLIFLVSIFDIYFHSPVITNLVPQPDLKHSPAKRLILIVADGLRAESFYGRGGQRTPFLKNIVLSRGYSGISNTRVPTESRPGHVAMISGLYEDPSAVTKGWQENPIDFDSAFNRSRATFAWGSPDILPIFVRGDSEKSHIFTDSYTNSEVDFSGKVNTSLQDKWVFDKFEEFLSNQSRVDFLKANDKVVIFLHLLGLDTAGHVHKPNSNHFNENLLYVDLKVRDVYLRLEKLFPDKSTAYLFTADHGMLDRGAHGSGNPLETETPIVAWGAGIKLQEINSFEDALNVKIDQADIAPLITSLIGVASPMNNFGILPTEFLDVSKEYLSQAKLNNARQIYAQFDKLRERFKAGKLFRFLSKYPKENNINSLLRDSENFKRDFNLMIKISDTLCKLSLEGLEYYHNYYQHFLLFCVTGIMVLWVLIALTDLNKNEHNSLLDVDPILVVVLLFGVSTMAVIFLLLQKVPVLWGIYVILPILLFYKVPEIVSYLAKHGKKDNYKFVFCLLCGIELLVLSFFYRFILSVLLLLLIPLKVITRKAKKNRNWIVSTILLAVFPSLPTIEKDANSPILLLIGSIAWLLVTYAQYRTNVSYRLIFVMLVIMNANLMASLWTISYGQGVFLVNQIVSWICFMSSLILPMTSSLEMNSRLWTLAISFSLLISITSLSYEPLFFLTFAFNVIEWIKMDFLDDDPNEKNAYFRRFKKTKLMKYLSKDLREEFLKMFQFMVYILVGFFGTGNIAAISSFDPNWVRCLVTSFKPILMATVIIVKLLAPILFLLSALHAIQLLKNVPIKFYFKVIFIICDIMGMHFLFLIKTSGSWLEIGQSITHFVLIEMIVLALILFNYLVLPLTIVRFDPSLVFHKKRIVEIYQKRV